MTQDRTPTVTRAQLAEAVQRATGLPKSDGAAMVASLLEIAAETLCRGEPLLLSGFGKFVVATRAARKGRNVKLGLGIDIAPRRAISFRPAPGLLKQLNPDRDAGPSELAADSDAAGNFRTNKD